MLPRYPNHLLRPGEADVPADNLKIWELQSNLVDILLVLDDFSAMKQTEMAENTYRNWSSNLTWTKRTRVPHLCTLKRGEQPSVFELIKTLTEDAYKGNVKLNALHEKRPAIRYLR